MSVLKRIRDSLDRFLGRAAKVKPLPRPRVQDPSGRQAGGETPHLVVEAGAPPFLIRGKCRAGNSLAWRLTDTSVARLEVAQDTFSARVFVVGPGITTLTISDGESYETRQIVVRSPQPIRPRGIAVTLEALNQ